MYQRYFFILNALFFLVSSSNILAQVDGKNDPKIPFPQAYVTNLNGENVDLEALRNGSGFTLIVYYKTSCSFCEKEFQQLSTLKPELMTNLSIIAISVESLESISTYREKMDLVNRENVHFIRDQDSFLKYYFSVKRVPANILYDQDGQLVLETSVLDDVLKYVRASTGE